MKKNKPPIEYASQKTFCIAIFYAFEHIKVRFLVNLIFRENAKISNPCNYKIREVKAIG
jgi:hypothetical protein